MLLGVVWHHVQDGKETTSRSIGLGATFVLHNPDMGVVDSIISRRQRIILRKRVHLAMHPF